MYFIELCVKLFKRKKINKNIDFNPFASEQVDESEYCEHIFFPVDSSGEILACQNCGLVVNKSDLKDINIFKRGKS